VPEKVLLVEGLADSAFYEALCRETRRKAIKVRSPGSFGAEVDSKTNAIHRLPLLLKQVEDGSIDRIGLVVDADYEAEHGLGFAGTLEHVRNKVIAAGFERETRIASGGFVFKHRDDLPSVGLWIMPDNQHEGMLEHFVQACIVGAEQVALHGSACAAVARLSPPLFKSFHSAKAEVATWLAWQRMPGAPVASAVGDHLIDLSSPPCRSLSAWLQAVFS
jgi:hypothetical protein